MIKKCIICGKSKEEEDFNIEHIIPEALGNRSLKINNVCVECNSKLGSKVDKFITEGFFGELLRNNYQVSGKRNKVPFPFKEGIDTDGNKVRLDHNYKPTLVPNVKKEDNVYKIKTSSKQEAIEIIEKICNRNNLNINERKKIEKQIENVKIESTHPIISYKFEINFDEVQLAIIKIAYEYSYLKLGEDYYNDNCGKELRRILQEAIENNKIEICNLINHLPNEIGEKINYLGEQVNHSHFLQMQEVNNNIILTISLFCESSLSYMIKISDNANKYNRVNFTEIVELNKF